MHLKSVVIISIIAIVSFLSACEESGINPGDISGKLINKSECKHSKSAASETSDSLSCIDYTFISSGNKLVLKHINSAFNCCPGEINCDISLSNDTIIIEESEEVFLCDCNCLYDLNIEITGIEAKSYILKIIEPYVDKEDWLIVEIDLDDLTEDSFCVVRKQYPWNLPTY